MLSQKAQPRQELAEPDEQDAREVDEEEDAGEHGEESGEDGEGSEEESRSGDEGDDGENDDGQDLEGEVDDHAPQNGDGEASDGVLSQVTLTLDDCHGAADDGDENENAGHGLATASPSSVFGPTPDDSDNEPEGPDSSCEFVRTPQPKGWREELFTTPQFGNSGPRRSEIVEMGQHLMEFFHHSHPHISGNFSWYLLRRFLTLTTLYYSVVHRFFTRL